MKPIFNRVRILPIIYSLVFALFFVPAAASAATYYVSTTGNDNTGTGSISNPWRTVKKACDTVTSSGNTIYVNAGTYTEAQCSLAVGVSLQGAGIDQTIIKSTEIGDWNWYLSLESPAPTNGNQTISGITFNGQWTSGQNGTWMGIWVARRSNVIIHDTKVINFFNRGVIFDGHGMINPSTDPGIYATGNKFYNNIVLNSASMMGGTGAGLLNIGGQNGMEIYNNTLIQDQRANGWNGWPIKYWENGFLNGVKITNNILKKKNFVGDGQGNGDWDFAIELFNIKGLEIANNTIQGSIDLNYNYKGNYPYSVWIHDNVIDHSPANTKMESGIIFEFATQSALVERNIINNVSHAILFNAREPQDSGGYTYPAPTGGYSALTDNVIRNNVFSNVYNPLCCGGGAGIQVWIEETNGTTYMKNTHIYNNVFSVRPNSAPPIGFDFPYVYNGTADGLFIRNNILKGFSDTWFEGNSGPKFKNTVITHNNLWQNGNNNQVSWIGGNPTVGYVNSNNLSVDPKFVSATDFHLQTGSPMIDAGFAPLTLPAGVATVPFNSSAPDMGYAETGATGNAFPVANAGPDQTITLPTNSVTLSGSGTDSDGTIASYAWTKVSTLAGTITSPSSAVTTVTGLAQGTHTFQLKVTDNLGATGIDTVNVVVNASNTATTFTFTGPTTGLVNTNSSAFTITPNAPYTGTVTITPSGGGLSSPIVKTFSNSAVAQTFTITPTAVGTVTLTPSNNGGLTNPSARTYVVAAASNLPPTANAGPDQTITLPVSSVTLNGSGTDSDGTIVSYLWTQAAPTAPLATIVSPNTASTQITGLAQGTYVFWLKVTDNGGATNTDQVTITVNPAVVLATTYTFAGPTSGNAGVTSSNFTLTPNGPYTGSITVAINGAGLATSVTRTFTNSSAPQTFTVTPSVAGTVTLTPSNNGGLTNPSARTYVVAAASNLPPTANAGPDQTITLPTNSVTLSGSGTDSDGTIASYAWTKVSTLAGTITSPSSAVTTVTGLAQGTHTFQLKVTDNLGATGIDTVNVVVSPAPTGGTYATWNPLDKGAKVTLSNNNLTASYGGGKGTVRSTIGKASGKWYWEVKLTNAGNQFIGVANNYASLTNTLGFDTRGWSIVVDDGAKFNGGNQGLWGPSFATGDTVGVALDVDNKKVSIYKNGTLIGTMFTNLSGTMYAAWGGEYSGSGTANFGATPFTQVPAGYNPGLFGASAPMIQVGSRVETTARVNVRSGPGTGYTSYGLQQAGADGAVIEGPSGSGPWWNVNFDSGVDGWVKATYLKLL